MRYEFECSRCGAIEEVYQSISQGPPQIVNCPLCIENDNEIVEMIHQFGTNFILKGNGWPGKELKKKEYSLGQAREKTDQQITEDKRNQNVVEEVISIRRQGKAAIDQFKKDNPQKFNDYQKAIKSGYRAKGKSFNLKNVN